MNRYKKTLVDKGWTSKKLAARWGLTQRRVNQICANPKNIHWDALKGLPTLGGRNV